MILSLAALALSATAFIIVLKERSRRPFAEDLAEFRSETERLIAEFNRVAERNIGIMDDRLAALDHSCRRARKAEDALKKAVEEAHAWEHLFEDIEDTPVPPPDPKEAFAYAKEETPKEEALESGGSLFEGFPVQKLKHYAEHRSRPQKTHELLLKYLKEKKNKEELLEMGFSANEINLALLSLSVSEEEQT